jgi:hypothetical protein
MFNQHKRMRNSQQSLLPLILTALLLFAQQAAFAHLAAHVRDHAPLQSQSEGGDNDFHSDLCVFHGSFDALFSAVGSSPVVAPRVANTAFEHHPVVFSSFIPAILLVPASRGPPAIAS